MKITSSRVLKVEKDASYANATKLDSEISFVTLHGILLRASSASMRACASWRNIKNVSNGNVVFYDISQLYQ